MIESRSNPLVKWVVRLQQDPSFRKKEGVLIIEGRRAMMDLMSRNPSSIRVGFVASHHDTPPLHSIQPVSDAILHHVSTLAHSDGYLAVVNRPKWEWTCLPHSRFFWLDAIQSPRNMGAIIRTAIAFGWTGVILGHGSCDPYHPESLRAMVGYFDQIPIFDDDNQCLNRLCQANAMWVALDGNATQSITTLSPPTQPVVMVLGNEGNGISDRWQSLIPPNQRYHIPIQTIDSLNVAVATGIACYHIQQRGPFPTP